MPYGLDHEGYFVEVSYVSIPHMGCMPYGPREARHASCLSTFQSLIWVACPTGKHRAGHRAEAGGVSIPHMGCMPYGRAPASAEGSAFRWFQSLIWVACPTGTFTTQGCMSHQRFQSLIWVACPTGIVLEWTKDVDLVVSIPHMGCMPYGRLI